MQPFPTGPEEILEIAEPRARLTAYLVIDSTRLGPAFGGIRIRRYPEERDALLDAIDLAGAMTLKAALAGLRCGGGKIVIIDRSGLGRGRAMEAIGRALNAFRGRFFTGRDYGMTRADLSRLRRVTRWAADDSPARMGDLGDATARGVIAAIRGALPFRGRSRDLAGLTFAVQGAGFVGLPVVRRLLAAGGAVTVADPDAGAAGRAARLGARIVAPERLARLDADVFVPAAVGGTIDEAFARRCRARVVCGPANNPLAAPDAEAILHERGIVFVPDTLASAGALIKGVLLEIEGRRDAAEAIDAIESRVRRALSASRRTGRLASEVALAMAARRLGVRSAS